jgi:hypothetical protein
MTNTQKAISWGLTGFFGAVCLIAAPQLSVGLFIKYGILSTALGFGITAISKAVGDAFPDEPSTYYPRRSPTYYPASTDPVVIINTPAPAPAYIPRYNPTYYPIHTPSASKPPAQYLGSRVEPVRPSAPPSAPKPPVEFMGRRVEPVVPSAPPKPPAEYLGSRREYKH